MTVAVHKRSRVAHDVSADGLATLCGRIVYRSRFRLTEGESDCLTCLAALPNAHAAERRRARRKAGGK